MQLSEFKQNQKNEAAGNDGGEIVRSVRSCKVEASSDFAGVLCCRGVGWVSCGPSLSGCRDVLKYPGEFEGGRWGSGGLEGSVCVCEAGRELSPGSSRPPRAAFALSRSLAPYPSASQGSGSRPTDFPVSLLCSRRALEKHEQSKTLPDYRRGEGGPARPDPR